MTITTTPTRITGTDELPAPTPAIPHQDTPVRAVLDAETVHADLSDAVEHLAELTAASRAHRAEADAFWDATPDEDAVTGVEVLAALLHLRVEPDVNRFLDADQAGARTLRLTYRADGRVLTVVRMVEDGWTPTAEAVSA